MSDRDWRYWWSLPGPSAFVHLLADDVRRGANLVVGLPRWAPEGLAQAVVAELRDDDLLSWHPLSLEGHPQDDPLGLVVRRYAPDMAEWDFREPVDLVDSDAFSGRLVWITGLEDASWAAWRGLLERYSDAVRRRRAEDRGLICVVTSGLSLDAFPKEDAALSVRLWQDVVTELDMLAWLHHLMSRRRARSAMHRRLQLRHALELVAYDPHLAREAASQGLDVLAAPAAWLSGVAAARGWSADTVACWEEGTSDGIDGRRVLHPALLAVADGAEAELSSLVWRAQVGVLFPFLEEERNRCLQDYGSLLRVPHDTGRGAVIRDRQDLEIGHIHHQLRRRAGAKELGHLRLLRDVRNALAHHESLAPELLHELVGLG
jgi:hypothetical protein